MPDTVVPHHQALGIHPGAFVQPDPPSSTDIQNHCLWVDTSTDTPYQLREWDAATETWLPVGIVSSGVDGEGLLMEDCLTFPQGQGICGDVTATLRFLMGDGVELGMDDTGITLPGGHRLEVRAQTSAGVLSDGSFEADVLASGGLAEAVAGNPGPPWTPPGSPWSFTNHGSTSRAGIVRNGAAFVASNPAAPYGEQVAFLQMGGTCEQVVVNPSEDSTSTWIAFKAARCLDSSTPHAASLSVFVNNDVIGVFPLDSGDYGDYSFLATLRSGSNTIKFRAGVTSGGISCALLDMEGASAAVLRLGHAGGQGYWQSDGDTVEEWAGGARRLGLPFAMLEAAPDVLVGKDPATNLPAFCPPPTPPVVPVSVPIRPVVPDEGSTDTTAQCGAAMAMADYLERYYANVAAVIGSLETGFASWLLTAVIDILIEALTDGAATGWLVLNQALIKSLANWFIINVGFGGSDFPALTTEQNDGILQSCFCALAPVTGSIIVTDSIISEWNSRLDAMSLSFTEPQKFCILALMPIVSTQSWQRIAYQGSATPSGTCSGFTCP